MTFETNLRFLRDLLATARNDEPDEPEGEIDEDLENGSQDAQ